MKTKERIDACMKLAEYRRDRLRSRQEYEWKITLAFRTLLAAAFAFFGKAPVCWVGPVAVAAFTVFWLQPVAVRQSEDQKAALYFKDFAKKILHNPDHEQQDTEPKKLCICNPDWWWAILRDWSATFKFLAATFIFIGFYVW